MRPFRRQVLFAIAAMLICLVTPALALPGTELTPAQQEALAPLAKDWGGLPENIQRHFLEMARRYPSLTPAQKQRMHDRLEYWSKLTPEQHEQARQKYKAFKKLPPATREQVKQMVKEQEAGKAAASGVSPATL